MLYKPRHKTRHPGHCGSTRKKRRFFVTVVQGAPASGYSSLISPFTKHFRTFYWLVHMADQSHTCMSTSDLWHAARAFRRRQVTNEYTTTYPHTITIITTTKTHAVLESTNESHQLQQLSVQYYNLTYINILLLVCMALASDVKVGATFVSTAGLLAAVTQNSLLANDRGLTAGPGGSRRQSYSRSYFAQGYEVCSFQRTSRAHKLLIEV